MKKLRNASLTTTESLLAMAVDRLSLLWWAKTKDGARGANRPDSVLEKMNRSKDDGGENRSFESPEEFEAVRALYME